DQGLTRSQEAVTLAQQVAHPFSLGHALSIAAIFHQLRREVRFTQERAEAAMRLGMEQGFLVSMVLGSILHGWALAQRGQAREGLEQMHQSMQTFRATILRPWLLSLLAEAYGIIGELEVGLTILAEALTLADTIGERWYDPELYRLKGELLLQ